LGGADGVSFFTSAADQTYPLRGFALDLDRFPRGTGLLVGYIEYRMPLWHLQTGLWTLPVYLERLHGAVFCDFGETFGDGTERDVAGLLQAAGDRLQHGRLGSGLELRLDLAIGWNYPLTLRGGLAVALWPDGPWTLERLVPFFSFGAAI
jgi:hypothetical protein